MKTIVEATIEIPMGTKNKYEVNKKTKKIKLDRVLYSALTYPGEYGFIEETVSSDGDPLDILIICNFPTFPGCVVDARVIGYLDVIDDGKEDEKIIAVLEKDPRYEQIEELHDIPDHQLIEIKDFFQNYKNLQNIKVTAKEFHSKEEAELLIEEARERYKKTNI